MQNVAIRSLVVPALLFLSSALAAAAPAPAAGTTTGRGPTTRPHLSPNTLIVFPFENNAMVGGRELADRLAADVKAGLASSGAYSVATFYTASPLLNRARGENSLTREEIEGVVDPERGTVDPTRAANVALRMGGRYALLGSIEAADVEAAQNRANVTVTLQLLDTTTGAPAKTAGVTGTFTGQQGAAREALIDGAARDAATRALTELGVTSRPATAAPARPAAEESAERPKRRTSYWLPLSVLLGVLIAGYK
jgi:hypothetical protein